jgi:ssDNA-binding Zn-finger/Zn-ribbon topoisomerase 1
MKNEELFQYLIGKSKNNVHTEEKIITCNKCGSIMVERNGKYGKFYGCKGYPSCKNIINIK